MIKELGTLWNCQQSLIATEEHKDKAKEHEKIVWTYLEEAIQKRNLAPLVEIKKRTDIMITGTANTVNKLAELLLLQGMNGEPLLWEDVSDAESLLQKYNKLIFCLRRMELNVSLPMKSEAMQWMIDQKLQPVCIQMIMEREALEVKKDVLWEIYDTLREYWDEEQKIRWLQYVIDTYSDEKGYLLLALIYARQGKLQEALEQLNTIQHPSEEERRLIENIKGKLHGGS